MPTTYVITGGAGFIGSNIAHELVKQGETVRIVDNFATGRRSNIEPILDKITLFEGDVTDAALLKKAFDGATYVLHLAALGSVPRSIADPLASNHANVDGALQVLLAARDCGVKRVVYSGSSSVYGNADVEYKTEDLPPMPLSPYAVTKYTAESYFRLFPKFYDLETVVLRYFNVFGPRQNPAGEYAAVIPKFIELMLAGKAPVIHGDGEQSRDFTFVANNVAATIAAAKSDDKAIGQTMNIACGGNITLNELVAFINKELGTNITPTYIETRAGDVTHSKASIAKAKELIGYEPLISVEEGLKQTIAWYKNNS